MQRLLALDPPLLRRICWKPCEAEQDSLWSHDKTWRVAKDDVQQKDVMTVPYKPAPL
jgi:hypothetical protein